MVDAPRWDFTIVNEGAAVKRPALKTQKESAIFDAKSIVPKVLEGDPTAQEQLYDHLTSRFSRYFATRFSGDTDDLMQDTAIGVLMGLGQFNPSKGKGDYNQNFSNWCFSIARYTLVHAYDDKATHPTARLVGDEPDQRSVQEPVVHSKLEDLIPKFREKLAEILTPGQFEVVEKRLDGRNKDEVIEELEITRDTYTHRMVGARARYEEQLFIPAGFKTLPNHALLEAARRGSLEAAHFLDRYYSTDELIRRYSFNRRNLSRNGSPGQEWKRVSELADTMAGYARLLRAVNDGKVAARKEGAYWFIKQEDFDMYNASSEQAKSETDDKTFGSQLLGLIEDQGYSNPNRVAAILGVSSETLRRWVNNQRVPDLVHLNKLFDILKVADSERESLLSSWSGLPARRRRGH